MVFQVFSSVLQYEMYLALAEVVKTVTAKDIGFAQDQIVAEFERALGLA